MFVRFISKLILYLFAFKGMLCRPNDCCRTPDGSLGTCIPITKCPSIQNILNFSPTPLPTDVADTLRSLTCGFIIDMPKVCCKTDIFLTASSQQPERTTMMSFPPLLTESASKPVSTTMLPFPSSTTEIFTSSETTTDVSLLSRDSSDPEDVSNHRNLNLLPLDNCGNIKESKVSKGNKTDLFQYPWMVLLQYASDNGDTSRTVCGGSLISDRYVLTAAHCVTQITSGDKVVSVRLGEYDTSTDVDCQVNGDEKKCAFPVQDIFVDEVFFHPQYNKAKFSNDIAVLRLARAANISSESVQPICLPTTFAAQTTTLRKVSIAGWGTTESQRVSSVLLQALLPIVPNDICQKMLTRVEITSSQMCAGGEGADSCSGDSGGPLIYPTYVNGVRMVQFGIISFGANGCTDSSTYPGVYSRVAFYMNWILDQMKP